MFRECRASGADSQMGSKAEVQPKYAVLTCARPFDDTVDIAHSVDAFNSRVAIDFKPAAEIGSRRRWTGIR